MNGTFFTPRLHNGSRQSKHLAVHLVSACIKHWYNRGRVNDPCIDCPAGKCIQGWNADDRSGHCIRQPLRDTQADSQTRERTGPDGHCNAINLLHTQPRFPKGTVDQRHQQFGVNILFVTPLPGHKPAVTDYSRTTHTCCCFDTKDGHAAIPVSRWSIVISRPSSPPDCTIRTRKYAGGRRSSITSAHSMKQTVRSLKYS